MKYIVLGGYGEMGKTTSRDITETAKGSKILIAGRDESKAKEYAKKLGKHVFGVAADVTKVDDLVKTLKENGIDIVVNCTNYYNNLEVMKACLKAGCHYVDLGGLFHMTRRQLKLHRKFKVKKLTAVLGCGATPGITNVLAGYGALSMNKIDTIHVRFADYDHIGSKQHFTVPYSMYTVFDEFTDKPAVFRGGKMTFVKPISGRAEEYFPEPIGKVTTFYTLHSEIATFPTSFKNKGLKNCDFKVSFDDDFVHDVKLMVETGLASKKPIEVGGVKIRPIDVTIRELNRLVPENKKVNNLEYVRVTLIGEQDGKKTEVVVDCLARSIQKWHASAWDVNTGTTPSIVAQLIARKKITERGVLPPEVCVPHTVFFHELTKRGMSVIKTTKRVEFG